MNKFFVFFIFCFMSINSFSQNFFVDASNGNDSNNGTSPSTAWRTISKVNNYDFNTSSGNIVVAFKRGEIWREQLSPNDGGTGENNRIIFTAYGTGRKPIILGSNSLKGTSSDWLDQGSNIWRRSLSSSPFYVIFEKPGTATNWGYQQSSSTACNSDYKFYYGSGYLYVYSIGNPATYYNFIENPARAFSIGEISRNYLTFDNIETWGSFESGIRTSDGNYTRITNCDIHHLGNVRTNTGDGLYIISSNTYIGYNKIWECGSHSSWSGEYGNYKVNNNIWEHNYIVNNYYTGIDLQHINTGGRSGGHIVRFNTIIDSLPQSTYYGTGVGVQVLGKRDNIANVGLSWVTNVKIYGNIIIGHYLGINIGSVCDSIYIYNNTLVNSRFFFFETKSTGGEFTGTWTTPWHGWIKNNIVYQSSGSVMDLTTDTNKVFDYNLYYTPSNTPFYVNGSGLSFSQWKNWGVGNHDINSISGNPQFINYSVRNYLLQSGSPAIDAGTPLPAEYNTDFLGTLRPQGNGWDIGAFETSSGPDLTPPRVLAAELINATTLRINFSESLDPNSTQSLSDYSISNGISVSAVSLNSSIITLTTSPHTTGNYTVTINNVRDLSGNLILSSSNSANYNYSVNTDVTPPTLLSAQIMEANELVLDFSEAISVNQIGNPNNYTITGGVRVLGASLSESGRRLFLTTTNQDTNRIYSITVNNIQDLAGNVISSTNNSTFYKLLAIPSIGWREYIVDIVNASATTDPNTSPAKTLDGLVAGDSDPNSRWAAQVMPQWIQYDLGSIRPVTLVSVSFYQWNNGRIYRYLIRVSPDANQWTEIVSNASSSSQEWTVNEFNNLNTRYIRIVCLSSNDADWAGLWEARIFGPGSASAVELSSFDANVNSDGGVLLSWTTISNDNQPFEIERKSNSENFVSIGSYPGSIVLLEPRRYSFVDYSAKHGIFSYRLKQKNNSGEYEYSNEVQVEINGPLTFRLEQNYPNPFNPITTLEFSVPQISFVTLKIFDILGSEVKTLVNEEKTAGIYKVNFDASGLASGTYFARIKAGDYSEIKKMVLLK